MPKRTSTGKRLRFEVFERDGYTCRYCGAQPPDVVLVADHVLPVAVGGKTTADNLVAACEACNQGKAARVLGASVPAPDTDLRYLQAQQEIAELRRYHETTARREQAIDAIVELQQSIWSANTGLDWVPGEAIVRQAMVKYSPEITERALKATGRKCVDGTVKRGEWWRYFWAVARNMADEDAPAAPKDEWEVAWEADILASPHARWFAPELFLETANRVYREHVARVGLLPWEEMIASSALAAFGRLARAIPREFEKASAEWYAREGVDVASAG